MKKQFIYTSQRELRKAFWQLCDELGINTNGKRTKFNTTLSCYFLDWIDTLQKDGDISERLRNHACLY